MIGGLILGYFSERPRQVQGVLVLQSAISIAIPAGLLLYPVFFSFPLIQMSGGESLLIFTILGILFGTVFGFVQALVWWLLRSRRLLEMLEIKGNVSSYVELATIFHNLISIGKKQIGLSAFKAGYFVDKRTDTGYIL